MMETKLAAMIPQSTANSSETQHVNCMEAYGEKYDAVPCRRPALSDLDRLTGSQPAGTLEYTADVLMQTARNASPEATGPCSTSERATR